MLKRAVSTTSIDGWRNDIRHGLRVLAKSRGFTAVAVVSGEADQTGQPASLMLTPAFCERRCGYARSIVGKSLPVSADNLNGVGVMSANFSLNKEVMPPVRGIQHGDLLLPLPLPGSAQ